MPKPLRVGFGRDLSQLAGGVPDTDGLPWIRTADGGQATALAVVSPSAAALRLRLVVAYSTPPGVRLRVYDAAGTSASVAVVPLHGSPRDGRPVDVWTPTVPGDAATVELYLPPGLEPGAFRVSVPVLSHIW